MSRWRRPYPLGQDVWLGVGEMAASAPIFVLLAAAWHRIPVWMAAWTALLAVGFIAGGVQRLRLGVYVSDAGVMSRSVKGTTRIAWRDVAGFRSAAATARGIDLGRQAVYLDLVDGRSVQTAVLCRPEFGQFDGLRRFGRARYWPDEYDQLLAALRTRWQAEQADQRPPPVGDVEPVAAPSQRPVVPARPPWHQAEAEFNNEVQLLTRKHRRGELTDDEYAAALARLRRSGQLIGE